ncbi:GDSL esterase/lipase At4g10955-like [Macadamia integrifolia]|uniref:GDSL esterase/lipase At4g10955-like n=1 Tax=Macadamia integrifolia TaxID=60698 RepID=UPI001C527A0E|nr:GDSL esterase/lipase At4g10955-like [Macadamia integrifolia]XP_042480177.1 GDSL esterase/lipase At4g10955-like [Macadamia integrifolia]XP_042480178.1 GDSL esterase/lipase At4g10955-like [Macadamia integrifolia]
MVSDKNNFNLSGPSHLTTVDWNNADDHRSVAASMVNGVYILEREHKKNRNGPQTLAPPWWEFFHFQLHHSIMDDKSICGAVYEFKPPASTSHLSIHKAPRYVIAFRGTILGKGSWICDIKSDILLFKNEITAYSRYEVGVKAVKEMVAEVGASNIWLAGHSLGSAMAMFAGKYMAKAGVYLQSFLFNPPLVSMPIEWIKDEKLKKYIRTTTSMITAAFNILPKNSRRKSALDVDFVALSSWVPCLFLNRADLICSEFIGYFENRKRMEEFGGRELLELTALNSIPNLLLVKTESEPMHVLPSADLIIYSSPSLKSTLHAHELCHWWSKEVSKKTTTLYQYRGK